MAGNQDLQASVSRDVRKLDGKIAVLTKAIDLDKTWREKGEKIARAGATGEEIREEGQL